MIAKNSAVKQALIHIQDLNKSYDLAKDRLQVLKNINLTIHKGEFISIMGPSGSGKSTLINVLGFLDNDFDGQYYFMGDLVQSYSDRVISNFRNQKVGFVFQSFNLIENMTVKDNVALPLLYQGMRAKDTVTKVTAILADMGLADKVKNYPPELSGGQRQRVAIARALVMKPEFLIADEPTGALDSKTSASIMAILKRINEEEGVTVVMVTHDPTLQSYASRHLVITDGKIEEKDRQEAEGLANLYKQEQVIENQGGGVDEA